MIGAVSRIHQCLHALNKVFIAQMDLLVKRAVPQTHIVILIAAQQGKGHDQLN